MTPSFFEVAERTASLLALILLFGAIVFRVRVAGPLRRATDAADPLAPFTVRLEAFAARVAVAAATVLVVLAAVRLHTHVIALFESWRNVGMPELKALLATSTWGRAWILQLVAALVIANSRWFKRPVDVAMAIPMAIGAAMSGHAAGGEMPLVTAGADALHLLAAGAWVGGVFFVFSSIALGGGAAGVLRVVRAFNTVALTCSAIVVATGLFAAYVHVGSFDALRSSVYGVQLVTKVIFVAIVAAAGAWNWRRATPALAAGDMSRIRRGVALEAAFSVAVILATARLVVMEPPSLGP